MNVAEHAPQSRTDGVPHYPMLIGDEDVDTDERYEVVNPADEQLVATVARGRVKHAAVADAKAAHESGVRRSVAPLERARILDGAADALADVVHRGHQRHVHRPGGDLRTGPLRAPLPDS